MAAQAKVVVALRQELAIHRTMWLMTNSAAFAQRFVFVNERPALLAVALRARFVEPRHRESARRFHDVMTVRIVALHAIHLAFGHWMMLRQTEIRVDVEVTLKTRRRIFSRIDDQTPSAAHAHMFAARPVARFAAAHLRKVDVILIESPMRAQRERAGDIRMAIGASRIPDEMRPRNIWRRDDSGFERRTGDQQRNKNENADAATNPQKISVHP
jgi:hypothetical protein